MQLVLSFITIVLLAVVGGVVLWLHWRLDALQRNSVKLPVLAGKMTTTLVQTQKAMAQLKQDLRHVQPEVDGLLIESRNTKQDMTYLLDKSEKVLSQLETVIAQAERLTKSSSGVALPQNVQAKIVQDTPPLTVPKAASLQKTTSDSSSETPSSKRLTSQAERALRAKLGLGV